MFKTNYQRFLKVKIKTLAEESKIIRLEEGRTVSNELREDLYFHRVFKVRNEARAALLAYAYLRGKPHYALESETSRYYRSTWIDKRAREIIKKFGIRNAENGFNEWTRLGVNN